MVNSITDGGGQGQASPPIDWDTLLYNIEQENVIPILGRDLCPSSDAVGAIPLDRYVAEELERELSVGVLGAGAGLSEVAFRYLQRDDARQATLLTRLGMVMRRLATPTLPLRQLAEIRSLRLFVTTGFDGLLERALSDARGGVEPLVLPGDKGREIDLPADWSKSSRPAVYHILGSMTGKPVLTEADLLERLHALAENRPPRLFGELRERTLLFLGCGFPDWLARFFIRIMKNDPFGGTDGSRYHIIADERITKDRNLVEFFSHYKLDVYQAGRAAEFVADLHGRWMERAKQSAATASIATQVARPIVKGAVFLSFSSLDREEVRAIAAELDKVGGVDCFFDERGIPFGSDWDRVIRDSLSVCSLFVPFISRNTEALENANVNQYLWKEWNLAAERDLYTPPRGRFILPVVFDGVEPAGANVPPRFTPVQWYPSPRPHTADLIEYIKNEYRAQQTVRR